MIGRQLLEQGGRIALGIIGMVAVSCSSTSLDPATTPPPSDFVFEGDGYKKAVDAELAAIDGLPTKTSHPIASTSSYRNSPPPPSTTRSAPLPSRPVASVSTPTQAPTKPTPAPSSSVKTTSHKVVKGDSLWGIGKRYGTTVVAIAEANGLSSDTIAIGQTLKIPSGGGAQSSNPQAAPASLKSHTVAKKDTLWSLSQSYKTSVEAIKKRNGMTSDLLSIGQKLIIP